MIAAELIRRGARQFASSVAVIGPDVRLTFAEVDDLANRVAAALGLAKGDRVGLLIGNEPYAPAIGFGCTKAGLVHVPLNTRLALSEHEAMLRLTGARVLVHSAGQAERARALVAATGADLVEAERDLLQAPPARDPQVAIEPDDTLLLVFTSGTTGKLKAVRHTQRTYAAVVANILANLVDPRPGDVMLHAASLIHASGTFVLPFWSRGAASAVLPGFEPAEFLEAIARWRVTHTNVVPTMLAALLQTPGVEEADVSGLRTIVYGASPTPTPLLERALGLWGRRLVQYYGQTEAQGAEVGAVRRRGAEEPGRQAAAPRAARSALGGP